MSSIFIKNGGIRSSTSYQRGSNENANGLVRRFFKKGTDFEFIEDKQLQKSVNIINRMPRKIHNGLSAHGYTMEYVKR